VELPDGKPERITSNEWPIAGFCWTPDSREIIFSIVPLTINYFLKVSIENKKIEQLNFEGESNPTISADGKRIAFQFAKAEWNIYRLKIPQKVNESNHAKKLISSTVMEYSAEYSPDGSKIIYDSNQSGIIELWLCDSLGQNSFKLTDSKIGSGSPRWSPDGRFIVFHGRDTGYRDIYYLNIDDKLPVALTKSSSEDCFPSWSRDARWIYFTSDRSGENQIWKMPFPGNEDNAVQVTKTGGDYVLESMDGANLFFRKNRTGIWKMPIKGGSEILVLDFPIGRICWTVASKGIYFFNISATGGDREIKFFNFDTKEIRTVYKVNRDIYNRLTISPDEKYLLYSQVEEGESDIWMVENWR
jgi:Tol biopolymer transport system component